jgi:hypothetical protein
MIYLVAGIIVALVVAIVVLKKIKSERHIDSRYICDVCGERDCICHKVDE